MLAKFLKRIIMIAMFGNFEHFDHFYKRIFDEFLEKQCLGNLYHFLHLQKWRIFLKCSIMLARH
jgi:hypothetical protein